MCKHCALPYSIHSFNCSVTSSTCHLFNSYCDFDNHNVNFEGKLSVSLNLSMERDKKI